MSIPELFETWAPPDRVWSQWAKPVLFANIRADFATGRTVDWPRLDAPNDQSTALIIDLPREIAVDYGIAAARDAFWPVPLFNCAFGPGAVLDVRELMERLVLGAPELLRANVPLTAPPAFLVDSKRMRPDQPLFPGSFDNRYIILPQDFPSGGFLKAHGITRVVWIKQSVVLGLDKTNDDLEHVLRRWQDAAIEIYQMDLTTLRTELVQIGKPSWFRSVFYRAMALAGLRRNSAGGFGGIIPQPSSGG